MRLHSLVALLTLPLLGSLACQGGVPTNPAATQQAPGASVPAAVTLPADVGLLGAMTVDIDPVALTAEANPVRVPTAFGDNFWLNATGFLDGAPCKDCFGVTGVTRNGDGQIVLQVNARHPFQPGNPQLPISGVNRLDLHVFDAAVLVAGNLGNVPGAFASGSATLPTRLVANAAGYSPLLTSVVQSLDPTYTASAWPYVMLNEDRTTGNWSASNPNGFADLQAPTGYNVFPMGADVTSEVVLGLLPADGPQRLTLLFTCAYGASVTGRTQRLDPRYPLPEFNSKAPWRVEAEIPEPTNNLTGNDPGSSATVNVRVWDWQQGGVIDPALGNIGAIRAASEVTQVELVAPGVRNSTLNMGAPLSGTGRENDPLTYSGQLFNELSAGEGDYVALICVSDNRQTGINAGGATDALSSQTGATIDPVSVTRFATYQAVSFSVGTNVPTRQLVSIDITPATRQIIAQGPAEAITFTAIGTFNEAPFVEDISTTATWESSMTDVMSFAANVGTGIGMGRTLVSCSQDGIDSTNTCEVIVKPEVNLSINLSSVSSLDCHQGTGEVFLSTGSTREVRVYSPDGTFLRNWTVGVAEIATGPMRGITVNEALNHVTLSADYDLATNDTVTYDLNGGVIYASNRQFLTSKAISYLDDGTFWGCDFTSNPFSVTQFNVATGATIGGWNISPFPSTYDMENVGNLLYLSTPGSRGAGRAWTIINPHTQAILGFGGSQLSGGGQNCAIAVDRDGFIHLSWTMSGSPLPPHQIPVYEFVPPSTVNLLYTYNVNDAFVAEGMTCYRATNDMIYATVAPGNRLLFAD